MAFFTLEVIGTCTLGNGTYFAKDNGTETCTLGRGTLYEADVKCAVVSEHKLFDGCTLGQKVDSFITFLVVLQRSDDMCMNASFSCNCTC